METRQEILQMNREREIDLIALMWEIIYHWRALFICAVAGAIGLAGLKYVSDARAYKNAQNPQTSTVTMEENSLSDEELQAVENALGLKKQIKQKEDYLAESVYMNLDAYKVNRVSVLFYATPEDAESFKDETLSFVSGNFVNAYMAYLSNGGLVSRLRKAAGKDMDVTELSELVRTTRMEGSQFMVNVYAEDEAKAEEMADKMVQLVNEYHKTVEEKIGRHELSVLERCSYISYDSGMAASQNEQREGLKNMRASLQTMTTAFTAEQTELYNGVMAEEMDIEQEAVREASPASVSKKYLVLGFLAGGFLVCMWIAGAFILSSRIYRVEELQNIYGLRIFGMVQAGEKKKRFLGFIDRLLDGLRQKESWTQEEQQKVILSNLLMTCKKEGIKSVMFTSAHHLDASDKKAVESMRESLRQNGIHAGYGENMIRNVTTFEEMVETGHIVFVEKENVSSYQVLEKELLLCIENKADVMGVVGLQ